MNIALWIVQGILAAMFLMAGITKLTKSKDEVKDKLGGWVDDVSSTGFKLIGLVELLGALGLILPVALNVLPILTPAAAAGLALTMIGALGLHIKRKEFKSLPMNLVLMGLSAFVLFGRYFLIS